MSDYSSKNTYRTSHGERLNANQIERRNRENKRDYLESFIDRHGYYFCERTKRSDKGVDCSHIVSKKYCLENGMAELVYNENNLELLCRDAHNDIEGWSNKKRLAWFISRKEGISFTEFIKNYKE